MTIKQVSVFLENKTGRINEVTKTLSQHGINMQAFSMAETPDFGILRLIVSDVDKAVEILRSADFAVMLTDVILLHCPNKAGALGESPGTPLAPTAPPPAPVHHSEEDSAGERQRRSACKSCR